MPLPQGKQHRKRGQAVRGEGGVCSFISSDHERPTEETLRQFLNALGKELLRNLRTASGRESTCAKALRYSILGVFKQQCRGLCGWRE